MNDLEIKWDNLYKVLNDYAVEFRNALQDSYIEDDRLASGELINSCEYIIEKDNISISVSIQIADYYKYIESGTKPHWPPVDAMLNYVKVKPILPRPDSRGKLPTPEQLAYLIGRKISQVGTEGTNNFHKTAEQVNEKYLPLIEEAITKDVDGMATWIITEFFREE